MASFNFSKPGTTTQGNTGGINLGITTFGQSGSTSFGQPGSTLGSTIGTNNPATTSFGTGLGAGTSQTAGLSFQQPSTTQTGGGLGGIGGTSGHSTGQASGYNFMNQPTTQTGISGMLGKPLTGGISSSMPFATKTDMNIQQPTGGLGFSQSSMGGGTFTTMSTTQPGMIASNQQPNKKDIDRWEIVNVIQNYINSLSPVSNMNTFKTMVYNRVPKGYESNIHNFQNYPHKIKGDDGTDITVDYNLWVKALQNNPVPQIYYPYQISSPSHLVQRIKTTEVLELTALETILNLQNNLNDLNNLYDNEIETEVSGIKKKLLYVISKMERLALITGKADRNYSLENSLNNRLNNIKNVFTETNDYTNKIKELSSMTNLMGYEFISTDDKDYLKEFDNNRFEKNVNILRDMKKIIDVTFNNMKQNMAVVNFIKNDIENLKRYGKIPK